MDIIPTLFSIAIPINIALFLHHIYYSHNYVANQADKLYYYITAIIPLAPAVIYSFGLIDYFTTNGEVYYNNTFLELFFKTWVISNPLLMINVGKVINISLAKYLVLIFADIGIYIIGYLSYKTQDTKTFIATFAVSSILFLLIFFTLLEEYMRNKTAEGMSNLSAPVKLGSKFIIVTWACYPATLILYKVTVITLVQASIIFIALDFLTKSVFSSIIIGYHRHLNRRKSLVDYAKRRVIPLETVLELANEYPTDASDLTEKEFIPDK
jgi:bacteriorhodopsin